MVVCDSWSYWSRYPWLCFKISTNICLFGGNKACVFIKCSSLFSVPWKQFLSFGFVFILCSMFNYLWKFFKKFFHQNLITCSGSAKRYICHQWRLCIFIGGRFFSLARKKKKTSHKKKRPMKTAFHPRVLEMGRKRVWCYQIMRRNMHAGNSN